MEKIGPKFSQLLTVRAEKADPLIGWSSVNVFIAFKIFLENITHCTNSSLKLCLLCVKYTVHCSTLCTP